MLSNQIHYQFYNNLVNDKSNVVQVQIRLPSWNKKTVILVIASLFIGGITMSLLVYNYYLGQSFIFTLSFNGNCYEFSGKAYAKYLKLEKEKEMETLLLQSNTIGDPKAIIPVMFSGTNEQVNNFISKYAINVTERLPVEGVEDSNSVTYKTTGAEGGGGESIGPITTTTKTTTMIIKGKITNGNFEKIIKNEFNNALDYNSYIKTIVHSLGIESNALFTPQESKEITRQIQIFTINGLEKIVDEKEGVNPIECGGKISYYVT